MHNDDKRIFSERLGYSLNMDGFDKESLFNLLCMVKERLDERYATVEDDIRYTRSTENNNFSKGRISSMEEELKFIRSLMRKLS